MMEVIRIIVIIRRITFPTTVAGIHNVHRCNKVIDSGCPTCTGGRSAHMAFSAVGVSTMIIVIIIISVARSSAGIFIIHHRCRRRRC